MSSARPSQTFRLRETDMDIAELTIARSVGLVRSEFLESPGLQLSRTEARRFWNFDSVTCDVVLDLLIVAKFLRQTPSGMFVRSQGGAH